MSIEIASFIESFFNENVEVPKEEYNAGYDKEEEEENAMEIEKSEEEVKEVSQKDQEIKAKLDSEEYKNNYPLGLPMLCKFLQFLKVENLEHQNITICGYFQKAFNAFLNKKGQELSELLFQNEKEC